MIYEVKKMVVMKNKITKIGNSYFFRIPKDLVDCEVIDSENEVTLEVKDSETEIRAFNPLIKSSPITPLL